jgi:probable rRNA maturation factor
VKWRNWDFLKQNLNVLVAKSRVSTFTFVNETGNPLPRVSFRKIAEEVMGRRYSLSVIFASPKKIASLNKTYRKKDTSTDILSFALSKNEGELYFSMRDVEKKAVLFGMTTKKYLEYLFIHGLIHLKGFDHGKKMDSLEKRYCKKFGFSYPD